MIFLVPAILIVGGLALIIYAQTLVGVACWIAVTSGGIGLLGIGGLLLWAMSARVIV